MEVSSVSSGVYAASPSMSSQLATQATETKNLQTQDKIALSVINTVQGQQKQFAEALIKMMESSRIDIYA